MLQLALRPYVACLLLLCLGRTLLPEAWVLTLHTHTHTTEEPAFASSHRAQDREMVTPRHTHCHVEQFYNVPFQVALPVAVPVPRLLLCYQPLAVPTALAASATELRRTALRGPPVA
ncbi:MAG: hypothetical protein ACRYFX_22585 [Janthinobacterium lividum]